MDTTPLLGELAATQRFFTTSTACFLAADAAFAPRPGMFTVAGGIAHVARTVDWFIEGAFARADGFDMDFERHNAEARAVAGLDEARAWVQRSFAAAAATITAQAGRLHEALPPGIMGGMPRLAVVGAIVDHSAHHRGALAVYARLLGREPAMPYG
jgi:uncharacterized damage-inducible protein DinB